MAQQIESEFGQIYEDPDALRRYPSFLGRVLAVVVLIAVIGPVIVGFTLYQQRLDAEAAARAESQSDLLSFSAVVALSPRAQWNALFGARGLEAVHLDTNAALREVVAPIAPQDAAFAAWRAEEVSRTARRSGDRTFTTVAPDGVTWEHFRVAVPGGATLLVGRPTPDRSGAFDATMATLVTASSVTLLVIAAAGIWLLRRTARPAMHLLDAVEDIRVRGEIRSDVRARIDELPSSPIELARLGSTLLDIESDARLARHQTEALLQAASTLGRSLDVDAVLNAALVELQDLLGLDRSALLQYDLHEDRFRVVTTRGHDEQWIRELGDARGEEMPTAFRALVEALPHQFTDTESEVVPSELRLRARRHDYRSLLAVPLTGHHEWPTVLLLHSRHPRSYSWDEIELSKSFASIAGAALRNAELFARSDERLREESSRLSSIVESVESGLLVAGSDDRVLYMNGTLRRLLPGDLAIGQRLVASDLLDALLDAGSVGAADRERLHQLETDETSWVDLELGGQGATTRHWRVRSFVVRDTTGRRIGRGQIWSDVSQERQLEEMKSGLLAAVSHEFRTPLALIKGYATTLLADDVTWNPSDQAEFLRLVSSEADRLTFLVQRILDMRRIDAGMVALQVMPVALDAVIGSAIDGLGEHRDRVRVGDHPSVLVDIDAARVTTVLRNLLENACTYSPPHQPVDLTVFVEEDALHVAVRDRGTGIDPALRHRIFDTFVRGDQGLTSEHRGVGLGLALSKGFVEAHEGRLWIEDPDDGVGTIFRFSLPCRPRIAKMATS